MKIPNTEHWAVLVNVITTVPGDERSRSNPGHGYPEHTVESIDYEAFTDYIRFENRVLQLTERKATFTAVKVQPLVVETTVSIKIG
jgi:hypothetical protein